MTDKCSPIKLIKQSFFWRNIQKCVWGSDTFKHLCDIWFFFTVCSWHVKYAFQSEPTLYSFLNVKELLARSRPKIWKLSDRNWTRSQNHLVLKRTLNHLAKLLSSSRFESSCSHDSPCYKKYKFFYLLYHPSQVMQLPWDLDIDRRYGTTWKIISLSLEAHF